MSSSIDRLAAQITRMERNIRAMSTTPQLAYSSIEDSGSINSNHNDGRTMAQYGGQFDGSFGAMALIGPTPPTPSMPVVTPITGGLTVRWDGLFANALNAPMDFTRVEVHVSAVSGFVPDLASTLRTTIETPRGCDVLVRLPVGLYYVKFVTRSLSGGASPGSVQGSGTSLSLASGVDLSDALATAEAYTDTAVANGTWVSPTLGNSWVDFGGTYAVAAYRKMSGGIVTLRGTVKSGTVAAAIFTLPTDYRPLAQESFSCASDTATARVEVTAAGVVSVANYAAGGSNASVSLSGIRFSSTD